MSADDLGDVDAREQFVNKCRRDHVLSLTGRIRAAQAPLDCDALKATRLGLVHSGSGKVVRRPIVSVPNLSDPFVTTRTFGETSMLLDRLRVPRPATVCMLCVAAATAWPASFATAQTPAPSTSAASSPASALTPEERAKREGDQVFRWILIHSDKPRKTAAPKDEKPAPVVTRVKPPARATEPAAEASVTAAAAAAPPRPTPPPVTVPVLATTPVVASIPAPEPLVVSKIDGPKATVPAPPAAAPEADVTEALRPLSQEEPKFPVNLVRTLRTGLVQVKFTVLPDGSVAEPAVVSTSNARLNPSALAAVAQWRFAPVRKPQHGVVDLGFNNAE
jgi:TonB family protein